MYKRQYLKYWVDDINDVKKLYREDQPKICVFDSETTGLHIKKDRPFMWVFGWLIPRNKQSDGIKGRIFAFDHDANLLRNLLELSKSATMLVGHNVKYDLHMTINGGVHEEFIYDLKNIVDSMGICRMSFDAVSALSLIHISEPTN